MSYFDSPIDRCEKADCPVLLDQTQEACAREHGCTDPHCPLARWFAPTDPRARLARSEQREKD